MAARTRNTFGPIGEAALARLESLTFSLAANTAVLPTQGERIEHEGPELASQYWAEPRALVVAAYLDEADAHAELPEQHELLAFLKARFVAEMAGLLPHASVADADDDEYDDSDEYDLYDEGRVGDALDDAVPLDEEPPEEEP